MYFSKSKYTSFRQCPKIVWLDKYKPEEKEIDESAQERMASGNIVGDLARTLFGDFTEVTTFDDDGKLDLDTMKRKTAECIDKGIENICETSFDYNGLYCAVDILRKENGGYAIYEVKSSTKLKYYYHSIIVFRKVSIAIRFAVRGYLFHICFRSFKFSPVNLFVRSILAH